MIQRNTKNTLIEMAKSFPVVTITGPRQSGKTTLARMTFPKKDYVSLEKPNQRAFAESDPVGFLNQFKNAVIIDEIQNVPLLLSYIQTIVDENQKVGFFILTGSNQFEYLNSISQSLAGRTGIIKLLPFSYDEIYRKNENIDLDQVLYTGFYPRIFDKKIRPELFYSAYLMTYLERDVRKISNIHNLSLFQKFIQLCAGRSGQILNNNSLANECGISNKTVEEWLSILEASFIIFRLQPYYNNFNKRIIKSSKLYFLDVGFLSYLLRIENKEQLVTHPLRGEIFETFVISEFIKKRFHNGQRENIYFFRDSNANEVDVIIDTANGPIPVEIKSSQTINSRFFKGLDYFSKLQKSTQVKKSGLIIGQKTFEERTNYYISGYSSIYELYNKLLDEKNKLFY